MKKSLTLGSLKENKNAFNYVKNPVPAVTNDTAISFWHNKHIYKVKSVPEKTLLDIALHEGIPMQYKCKKGKCGKCIVQIKEGFSLLEKETSMEISKLEENVNKNYRLSCQSYCK